MTKNIGIKLIVLLIAFSISGCGSVATKHKFYEPITADLKARKYGDAVAKVDAALADKKYSKKDRLLYYIDAGMTKHYAGMHNPSNEKLTMAEDAAEELFT